MLLGTIDLIRGPGRFVHVQDTASDNWVIVHNLNSNVIATDAQTIHKGHNTKIIPKSVDIIDANTISVKWSLPRTGTIRIG